MSESAFRRHPDPRSPRPRRVVIIILALVVFAVGVALGQALSDGPPPPSTATYVRTLEPLPQQPGTTTTP